MKSELKDVFEGAAAALRERATAARAAATRRQVDAASTAAAVAEATEKLLREACTAAATSDAAAVAAEAATSEERAKSANAAVIAALAKKESETLRSLLSLVHAADRTEPRASTPRAPPVVLTKSARAVTDNDTEFSPLRFKKSRAGEDDAAQTAAAADEKARDDLAVLLARTRTAIHTARRVLSAPMPQCMG